jgi:lysozyme
MKINTDGLNLIKEFEGCSLDAYLCPSGVPTIGYGHTGSVRLGSSITQVEADRLLKEDLAYFEQAVSDWAQRNNLVLSSNEFSACVSLAFNIGAGGFIGSTVASKLRDGDKSAAANAFLMWNKADGVVLPGLDRRRRAERDLFLKTTIQPIMVQNSTKANFTVKFKVGSWLKSRPISSSQLGDKEKIAFSIGAELNVAAIAADKEAGHHMITLGKVNGKQLEYMGRNTLWVFGKDVEVIKNGILHVNNPVDKIVRSDVKGLNIPGVGLVGMDTPIVDVSNGGGFLTWAMATHGGVRMPNEWQTQNIITIARRFEQEIRPVLERHTKQPINVTSWFRPEPWNGRAGGVINSTHLDGGAIDFWVDPLNSIEVYRLFDRTWSGGLGYYANGISHFDIGANRRWQM